MSEVIPKVKKAAMLPNNFIMLDFDNGERRYLHLTIFNNTKMP